MRPFPLTFPFVGAGVEVSGSTIKAPLTLILTLPGRMIVLSISSVEVMVRGLRLGSGACPSSTTAVAGSSLAEGLIMPVGAAAAGLPLSKDVSWGVEEAIGSLSKDERSSLKWWERSHDGEGVQLRRILPHTGASYALSIKGQGDFLPPPSGPRSPSDGRGISQVIVRLEWPSRLASPPFDRASAYHQQLKIS